MSKLNIHKADGTLVVSIPVQTYKAEVLAKLFHEWLIPGEDRRYDENYIPDPPSNYYGVVVNQFSHVAILYSNKDRTVRLVFTHNNTSLEVEL